MSILSFAGKVLKTGGSLLAGKTVEKIITPKTPEQMNTEKHNLELLTPKAQFWKSIARPSIAMGLVGTLILGVIIQYIQQIFGVDIKDVIKIPDYIITFDKIVVSAYIGSRGLEKILGKIL